MNRQLKVSAQYQRRRWQERQVPFIRLSGKWLARAGFSIGSAITVRVQERALIIHPS